MDRYVHVTDESLSIAVKQFEGGYFTGIGTVMAQQTVHLKMKLQKMYPKISRKWLKMVQ